MRKFCITLSLAVGCLAGQFAHAESSSVRQHQAHIHGIGQLNVALEDGQLEIELISPAVNIVGFEHEPETDEQKRAVEAAMQTLEDLSQVFGLPSEAGCQLAEIEIEASLLDEHEHEDKSLDEEAHSEFHVHYTIQCATPAALGFIDV